MQSISKPLAAIALTVSVCIATLVSVANTLADGAKPTDATVVVYKSPSCGCCGKWVEHMERAGFVVETRDRRDLAPIKSMVGVPERLRSCHTAVVDGYVIEGHVPADDVQRLLVERPKIKGLAVPGMPMGSPGMEGPRKDRYSVIAIGRDGKSSVYHQY